MQNESIIWLFRAKRHLVTNPLRQNYISQHQWYSTEEKREKKKDSQRKWFEAVFKLHLNHSFKLKLSFIFTAH